ncbi:DUF4097 domain-containing protein [Salipaludibacillus sp. CUR1]|uniref:DUF4097 family beta strand repeat-containing protein n=1 Tax=Salipaludibacillus sp. CUR1 TaxID=2820003 RepID=UPI001E530A2D|nr:DUF4097 domain-containing protein [Salipaludibacillus sp. CUR1]MCE7793142.1 DUF4097 domain-containing protein [Salipaludibacillus sp. CUR1]
MHEERKMILKMIEDGKITAEEGLQLLNALKDEKGSEGARKQKSGPHSDPDPFDDTDSNAGKKSTDHYVSRDVNWEGGGYRRAEEKMTTFATKFSEFVDDAVHKIKEFDLDFNFGSSVEIQHIFHHRNASVKEVDIHVENGSITFRPWDEDDVRVECNVKVYKVRDTDEARRVFLDDVMFNYADEKVKLDSRKKSMKVNTTVYVPRKSLEKIKLYAFNGKISGENVTLNKLETQTVNGRISFEALQAEEVRLETVNGTVSVTRLEAGQSDIKTVNGTISVNTAKGDLDAETLNGTVHYTLLEPANARAYIKTTTGSVNVRVPDGVKTEGELKSTVGGISCDLPQMTVIDEKKEFASKKMSFLSNKNEAAHFYVEAEATTGAISVKN